MRANLAPIGLMLLALLGALAVPAAAQGASDQDTYANNETASDNETQETNETAAGGRGAHRGAAAAERAAAAQERRAELMAAREAALASFHENRTAAIEDFRAAHNATRTSFLENKTRVIDECRALREAHGNETAEGNGTEDAYKHCVRDGLQPLIEQARAEHKEQRETFQERMREARQGAMGQWMKERQAVNERHAARGGA